MRLLTALFLLLGNVATAQTAYKLAVFVDGEPVAWTLQDEEQQDGGFSTDKDTVTVLFGGGKLDLNLADWGTFDYAHVLGTTFKTSADTYTVSATVRHDDAGWDDYADAFQVKGEGVTNGLRELLHPHVEEQPFTRSQSGVKASGLVWLEAKTNAAGSGGSKIYVNLSQLNSDTTEVRYTLEIISP